MEKLGYAPQALKRGGIVGITEKAEQAGMAKLAEALGVGEMTLRDIAAELEKPGRDPRDELPAPVLRTDVLGMEDLKPGMELTGTVRNVIDFGAFVDIGVHQDGLVHISRMADRFIRHPRRGDGLGGRCGHEKAAHCAEHGEGESLTCEGGFSWGWRRCCWPARPLWRRKGRAATAGAARIA